MVQSYVFLSFLSRDRIKHHWLFISYLVFCVIALFFDHCRNEFSSVLASGYSSTSLQHDHCLFWWNMQGLYRYLCFLVFIFCWFQTNLWTLKLLDECSSDGDCEAGLYCFSCLLGFSGSRCVRSTVTNQFKLTVRYLSLSLSLPFA